jgi:hypothetical protein
MEPKLRSSTGASKMVRERLIATRDRSRLARSQQNQVLCLEPRMIAQKFGRTYPEARSRPTRSAAHRRSHRARAGSHAQCWRRRPQGGPARWRCPRQARCRGTSRRCRAVRGHSAGRGARPAGHPTTAGVPTPALRRTGGRTRRRPTAAGCDSRSTRGWIFTIPMRASIRWRLGGWLPASTASSSQARSASTGGEREPPKAIESTRGRAATSRRSERRVAFTITPAAERIAVGSART